MLNIILIIVVVVGTFLYAHHICEEWLVNFLETGFFSYIVFLVGSGTSSGLCVHMSRLCWTELIIWRQGIHSMVLIVCVWIAILIFNGFRFAQTKYLQDLWKMRVIFLSSCTRYVQVALACFPICWEERWIIN